MLPPGDFLLFPILETVDLVVNFLRIAVRPDCGLGDSGAYRDICAVLMERRVVYSGVASC